jgi:type II secretory pathway pseudopilin PulG
MIKICRSNNGMGLVEVMIAIGLLSAVLFSIGLFWSWNQRQSKETAERGVLLNILRTVPSLDLCKSLQVGIEYLQTTGGAIPPSSYDTGVPNLISPTVQYSGTTGIGDAFTNHPSLDQNLFQLRDDAGNEVTFQGFEVRLRPAQEGGLYYLKLEYRGKPPRVTGTLDFTTWGDPLKIAKNKRFLANVFVDGICQTP